MQKATKNQKTKRNDKTYMYKVAAGARDEWIKKSTYKGECYQTAGGELECNSRKEA
jgi:hypothetical protein